MMTSEAALAEKTSLGLGTTADSEAETERLHISPVKRKASERESSASKRIRTSVEDSDEASASDSSDRILQAPSRNGNGPASARSREDPPENGRHTKQISPSAAKRSTPGPAVRRELRRTGRRAEPRQDARHKPRNDARRDPRREPRADDHGDVPDNDDAEAADGYDEADAEEEEDDDGAEQAERVRAIAALTEIEVQYAALRDRLHHQQIARHDLELRMCYLGTHPELEAYQASIRIHNKERLARSRSLLEYQRQSISTQTKAMRVHILQQHQASIFRLRLDLLQKSTRNWYQVNRERRAAERMAYAPPMLVDPGPSSPVETGQGVAKYSGLPAAPEIPKATRSELQDDLRQLGLLP